MSPHILLRPPSDSSDFYCDPPPRGVSRPLHALLLIFPPRPFGRSSSVNLMSRWIIGDGHCPPLMFPALPVVRSLAQIARRRDLGPRRTSFFGEYKQPTIRAPEALARCQWRRPFSRRMPINPSKPRAVPPPPGTDNKITQEAVPWQPSMLATAVVCSLLPPRAS